MLKKFTVFSILFSLHLLQWTRFGFAMGAVSSQLIVKDVNPFEAQDDFGQTPLHVGIYKNHLKITQLLLLTNKNLIRHKTTQFMNFYIPGGARIDLPAGSSPLDLARAIPDSENKQKMIELLESFEFLIAFQSKDASELVTHVMDQKKVV